MVGAGGGLEQVPQVSPGSLLRSQGSKCLESSRMPLPRSPPAQEGLDPSFLGREGGSQDPEKGRD